MATDEKDNRTWIIDEGAAIIEKRCSQAALSPIERLIYCIWVADYSMTNAGDLLTATDLYPQFQAEAANLANQLSLPVTQAAFSQPMDSLQARYDDVFDQCCDELRASGLRGG